MDLSDQLPWRVLETELFHKRSLAAVPCGIAGLQQR
jgi:hypothetical protein